MIPPIQSLTEDLIKLPQELIDAIKNRVVHETYTPASTKVVEEPVTQNTYKWVNGVKTLVSSKTFTRTKTVTTPAKTVSNTYGRPMLNEVLNLINFRGHERHTKISDTQFEFYTFGVKFKDPQGVMQDIKPKTSWVEFVNNNWQIRHDNGIIQRSMEVNPEQHLCSFIPIIVESEGVLYNRSLINGRNWHEVDIRSLMTSWGKTNQDFVWRWRTWGNNPSGHVVDGSVTAIVQLSRNDAKAESIAIQEGQTGVYLTAEHKFQYPTLENAGENYIAVMLEAEFLPAQYKQFSVRGYHLIYPYGYSEAGFSLNWPQKDFDPNRELY